MTGANKQPENQLRRRARENRTLSAAEIDGVAVRVERIEIQTLYGQTVGVKICTPAACAGSSSWGGIVPKRAAAEVLEPMVMPTGMILDARTKEAAARSRERRRARVAA